MWKEHYVSVLTSQLLPRLPLIVRDQGKIGSTLTHRFIFDRIQSIERFYDPLHGNVYVSVNLSYLLEYPGLIGFLLY